MKIIESNLCVERFQWRFPRAKKRRIRRKWAKRDRNCRERPTAYLIAGTIVCHPSLAEKLRATIS